jgi:hypothetical protein
MEIGWPNAWAWKMSYGNSLQKDEDIKNGL